MANMSVVDKIRHYQRSLDKCTDHGTRTLHCIEKLYRLPVTVQHLQETGVGRTVNALRKYDGSIGDAAKALVAKWKTMVVDEDSSDGEDEDEACIPDAPEGYSDSNSPKPDKSSREEASRNSSKQKSSDSREKSRDKHESRDTSKNSSSTSESTKVRDNETKTSRETSDDREYSKYSKNGIDKKSSRSEDKSEKRSKSSRESKSDSKHSVRESSSHRSSSKSGKDGRNKLEDCKKDSSRVSSSSGGSNHNATNKSKWSSNDSQRKRKLESSSSERETSKRRKSLESSQEDDEDGDNEDNDDEDEDDDVPTKILSRDSDDENEKILPDTSIESDSEDETLKTKIKRETPESPIFYERGSSQSRNSTKTEKSSKSKHRDNTEKSQSTSDKSRRDSEKRSKSERATSEHRKNEKRKDETRSPSRESSSSKSKSHGESSSSSRHRSSSKHKDESRESSKNKRDNKSDSDSKESKEKFKEPKDKKVKKKKKINGDGGIDCNSGASFAEALGMCTDRPSSRKKNAVSPSSPLIKTIKTEPSTSSSSSSSGSKTAVKIKTEPPTSSEPQPLSLLAPNVKLEPLNVDLASTLPEISPNYKPLPAQYMSEREHRKQDEDKSLSDAIYSKGQRTKVYSGMKSGYTSVPSLCEVCIRILIKHMDALGFTGGIPYDILKPVLERAMPDQLFTLENYNPYLIEDTDSLWQFHCNREFREKRREEMESWRDMYMRCRDEREIKLKALTANIKESIDKSVPVRSTKLAYVDNVVKPPRNVLRNQARYGTAKSSTPTSDLKKKLILSGSSNSATNISVPAPPMSRMKSSSSSSLKKNKAPLMAKALQLIKGRYKR